MVTCCGRSFDRRAIRLVTFDLDDTLWSMAGVLRRAEAEMLAWLRRRAPQLRALDAAERRSLSAEVAAAHPRAAYDISLRRELMVRSLLEQSGYPRDVAAPLAAGAFAVFLDWRHKVKFLPQTRDTLERLRGDYILAALTNGNAEYRRLGLGRYFTFGYNAAEAGAEKPAPAMFERALARAGVRPSEAVHVGDHPIHDIQGAAAVGMATIWARTVTPSEPSGGWLPAAPSAAQASGVCAPNATITNLADLPATVAALGRRARPKEKR